MPKKLKMHRKPKRPKRIEKLREVIGAPTYFTYSELKEIIEKFSAKFELGDEDFLIKYEAYDDYGGGYITEGTIEFERAETNEEFEKRQKDYEKKLKKYNSWYEKNKEEIKAQEQREKEEAKELQERMLRAEKKRLEKAAKDSLKKLKQIEEKLKKSD